MQDAKQRSAAIGADTRTSMEALAWGIASLPDARRNTTVQYFNGVLAGIELAEMSDSAAQKQQKGA